MKWIECIGNNWTKPENGQRVQVMAEGRKLSAFYFRGEFYSRRTEGIIFCVDRWKAE